MHADVARLPRSACNAHALTVRSQERMPCAPTAQAGAGPSALISLVPPQRSSLVGPTPGEGCVRSRADQMVRQPRQQARSQHLQLPHAQADTCQRPPDASACARARAARRPPCLVQSELCGGHVRQVHPPSAGKAINTCECASAAHSSGHTAPSRTKPTQRRSASVNGQRRPAIRGGRPRSSNRIASCCAAPRRCSQTKTQKHAHARTHTHSTRSDLSVELNMR
jgi:hypothetical protein